MEHLTAAEKDVAEFIWKKGSLSTAELLVLCEQNFNWKKSTTYTILKRLENKNILKNKNGQVIPLISKEEYQSEQGCNFIDQAFNGSLPGFLTAFTKKRKLKQTEIQELLNIIDTFEADE